MSNETEQSPPQKRRNWLAAVFNKEALSHAAVGFIVTNVVKVAVSSAAACVCAPVAATGLTMLATAMAVGALSVYWERRKDAKAGKALTPVFSKATAKSWLKKSAWSLAGSLAFVGLNGLLFDTCAAPVAPTTAAPVAPVPAPTITELLPQPEHLTSAITAVPVQNPGFCATPMNHIGDIIQNNSVSDHVKDAFARAASGNSHVAAQGRKDLAYFLFNGFDGMPKDQATALNVFCNAAEMGNTQAQVDLYYIQKHGLAGVVANKEAAIAGMQSIADHSRKAAWFLREWRAPAGEAVKSSFRNIIGHLAR